MIRRAGTRKKGLLGLVLGCLALLGLGCKDIVEAPANLAYPVTTAVYTAGTAIAANTPTHTGGDVDTYTVSPALPAGLSLAAKTGTISGTPTTVTAATSYTVTATNAAGSTTASLSITVNGPGLTITTQPASQAVLEGATATFTVVASGTGALTYQWMLGGTDIADATTSSYTTPATTLADSGGSYTVRIADSFGDTVTSSAAVLTVSTTPTVGSFAATGSLSGGRYLHTTTLLSDGSVLVAGGYLTSPVQTVERYDPAAGTFSAAGSLGTPRYGHTATRLANGKVLLAGGYTYGAPTATAELYDPVAGTLASTGALTRARAYHSATLLPSGKVLLAGGRDSLAILQTAELYDPATGTFSAATGSLVGFRYNHSATLLATGKVLLAGGYGASTLATAELYDPATGTFAATGSMASARYWHTATLLASGKVLVAGGASTLALELYDPTTGTFSAATGTLSAQRFSHTASLLADGRVLLAGGKTSDPAASGTVLGTAELFDPATGTLTTTSAMTQGRYYHSAAVLADGKVLLVGGIGGSYTSAEVYQ